MLWRRNEGNEKGGGEGVIIFDDGCPFCLWVSGVLEKFGFRRYPISLSFRFLEEEVFNGRDVPFALYFIDDEGVYWGEEAVARILQKKGFGKLSFLAYIIYPILKEINRNAKKENRKRGICGCRLSGKINMEKALSRFEKYVK